MRLEIGFASCLGQVRLACCLVWRGSRLARGRALRQQGPAIVARLRLPDDRGPVGWPRQRCDARRGGRPLGQADGGLSHARGLGPRGFRPGRVSRRGNTLEREREHRPPGSRQGHGGQRNRRERGRRSTGVAQTTPGVAAGPNVDHASLTTLSVGPSCADAAEPNARIPPAASALPTTATVPINNSDTTAARTDTRHISPVCPNRPRVPIPAPADSCWAHRLFRANKDRLFSTSKESGDGPISAVSR